MKITAIQSDLIWENIEDNLTLFDRKLKKIDKDTDLLVLPEMFSTGFTSSRKLAENENGLALTWLKSKVKEYNLAIIASFIYCKAESYSNRLYFVHPTGKFQYYDKRHLFGTVEKANLTSGKSILVVEYKGWRILPLICYDLRFPVWSRNKQNYDLLIYIANWPDKRIEHWKALLKARAIENQTYTIGVNRVGVDGNNYQYNGNSMFFSPKGELLNTPIENAEAILSVKLALEPQVVYRKFFDVQDDADDFEMRL